MINILLFISEGTELLELSPFIDVFGWNSIVGDKKNKIKLNTISFGEKYTSFNKIKITPEFNLCDKNLKDFNLDNFECIIIPGGFGKFGYFDEFNKEEVRSFFKNIYSNEKLFVGICTGAIALGILGILQKKKATTYLSENKRYFNQLSSYGAIPTENKIVIDENIITSSNPESGLEVAFLLLEKFTSTENMNKIKKEMGYKIIDEI